MMHPLNEVYRETEVEMTGNAISSQFPLQKIHMLREQNGSVLYFFEPESRFYLAIRLLEKKEV